MDTVRDHLNFDPAQIDRVCLALATLRPLLPIKVVALAAGVNEAMVRSFVADIGHPLLLAGEHVQFRDEPTESWFQSRFKPQTNEALALFVGQLQPRRSPDFE
jgi:hypothetical protein